MIDAVPVQAALVDASGRIVAVNAYWRKFAEANGYADRSFGLGLNYLATCRTAESALGAEARVVAEGLESILSGARDEFSLIYPCHSPTERRWFRLLAAGTRDAPGAVILHFNITPEMLAEERQAASRIEAERKLSRLEQNMEKRSRDEVRTLEAMTRELSDGPALDENIRTAYRAMIEASIAPGDGPDDRVLPEMARALARRLAERGADASDVAHLHAETLRDVKQGATKDRARWIDYESRIVVIGVLGHLANAYRRTPVR
jgi:hypothetical protein